jgi:hypothetical protein
MSTRLQLSRRSFLGGTLAVVAATTIPLTKSLPVIYGDGIRDDTAGLRALFSKMPVDIVGDQLTLVDADHLILRGGTFVISDTIQVRRPNVSIQANMIRMIGPADRYMFEFLNDSANEIIGNTFITNYRSSAIRVWGA